MNGTWYPDAVRLEMTTSEYDEVRQQPTTSVCEHITAGEDSRSWLQHADNGSSVHFLIRIENGKAVVYQFMPIEYVAYGNGRYSLNNPYAPQWIRDEIAIQERAKAAGDQALAWSHNLNQFTISIEHEGVTPTAQLYTGPMLDATLKLNKWLADKKPSIVRNRTHIIGHYQIDHIERANCPGGPGGQFYPFDTVVAALNTPTSHHFPETGQDVAGDFYTYWLSHGDLPIFGYPIRPETDSHMPDGSTIRVQSFERARFERHPNGILLGLVEAERLACRGL